MLIHRENALKAHQQISYCSIQRDHFLKISRRVACPIACVQPISLFLYENNHFFIQNAIKIYTKTHQL